MRPYALQLLTLATYTTAMAVPVITADEGEASSGHIQKRHARQSHGFRNSWGAGRNVPRPRRTPWEALFARATRGASIARYGHRRPTTILIDAGPMAGHEADVARIGEQPIV
jgi:hypothetical protein